MNQVNWKEIYARDYKKWQEEKTQLLAKIASLQEIVVAARDELARV